MELDRGEPFRVRDAMAGGVPRSRMRRRDLRRDFHGVRVAASAPESLRSRCASLQLLLDERHAFTGVTAARLWGMPLPRRFEATTEVHVATSEPGRAIRHRRTVGSERPAWWRATHVADFAVTPTHREPSLTTPDVLAALVERGTGMVGIGRLRAALARVRVGARSRPETLLRLLLAVEFDGVYHRAPEQFARDLVRTDDLVDDGWLVVHVVAAQLFRSPSEIVARVTQRLASRGAPTRSVTRFPVFEP